MNYLGKLNSKKMGKKLILVVYFKIQVTNNIPKDRKESVSKDKVNRVGPVTMIIIILFFNYDALCDLLSFAQFKKRKKHPWWSDAFNTVAGFSNFPRGIILL